MLPRSLPHLYRSLPADLHLPQATPLVLNHYRTYTGNSIKDPSSSKTVPLDTTTISFTHPRDPSNSQQTPPPSDPGPSTNLHPPRAQSYPTKSSSPPAHNSNVPTTFIRDPAFNGPTYTSPPFHTHSFFTALEKTFPETTARSLMRATRALLVDRLGRVRREALTVKDLDNVCAHGINSYCL